MLRLMRDMLKLIWWVVIGALTSDMVEEESSTVTEEDERPMPIILPVPDFPV